MTTAPPISFVLIFIIVVVLELLIFFLFLGLFKDAALGLGYFGS